MGRMLTRARDYAQREVQQLCTQGHDSLTLRVESLPQLRKLIPFECAWWASADPATLLFTSSVSDEIPQQATPLFVANEFFHQDVNKFSDLAQREYPVGALYAATAGKPERSARYCEILKPFGMGDELRVALLAGGMCWGYICLHRDSNSPPFREDEASMLGKLSPHLAAGMRNALLLDAGAPAGGTEPPGVVTLAGDLSIISMTPNAERWLEEIADWPPGRAAGAVWGVAARLLAQEHGKTPDTDPAPSARVCTRTGRWLTLHALRLTGGSGGGELAVIMEPARAEDMAPLLLSAYTLTERERGIALCVLRGMSSKAIARTISVSPLTVQQHLKAVFEKVGVHSRGELIGRVLSECKPSKAPHLPK